MTETTSLTFIAVVLDRSGSMASIRDDAIGGFNTFVEEQRARPGRAVLFLAQFDDQYEVVFDGLVIADVPALTRTTFLPRGSTALLDAIGHTITRIERSIERTPPAQRPENVVVLVITDGEENASRDFSSGQVRELIRVHQSLHGWTVLFFGSASRAITAATDDLGIDGSNTVMFTPASFRAAFGTASAMTSGTRTGSCMAHRNLQGEPDPKEEMN